MTAGGSDSKGTIADLLRVDAYDQQSARILKNMDIVVSRDANDLPGFALEDDGEIPAQVWPGLQRAIESQESVGTPTTADGAVAAGAMAEMMLASAQKTAPVPEQNVEWDLI